MASGGLRPRMRCGDSSKRPDCRRRVGSNRRRSRRWVLRRSRRASSILQAWPRRARGASAILAFATNRTDSIDLRKVAVTAKTVLESRGTRRAVLHQRFTAVVPLLDQRITNRQAVAPDGGAPVRADAYRRERGDVVGELFGLGAHSTIRHQILAEPDAQAFIRGNLAAGQNDFERPALADDARKADGSAVDQGDTPAPAVDAEIRVVLHHPEITPQRKFHPARDGRAGDGGDHGLIQFEA